MLHISYFSWIFSLLLFFSSSNSITSVDLASSIQASQEEGFSANQYKKVTTTTSDESGPLNKRWVKTLNNQDQEGRKSDNSHEGNLFYDQYSVSDNHHLNGGRSLKDRWSTDLKRKAPLLSNEPHCISSCSLLSSCSRVLPTLNDHNFCSNYEKLPLDYPESCEAGKKSKVPKIYHVIYGTNDPPFIVQSNTAANPQYRVNYQNDESAETYIRKHCGEHVAEAYNCFVPTAYRADIFRFCALYAEGGLYMDADMVPVGPFETLYSNCSGFSLGHDFPWGGIEGKQMKILASEPKHGITLCMLESIVGNVKNREIGDTSLSITGPTLLHKCYQKFIDSSDEKVAITYLDTREAVWPYTGMRTTERILAYEVPNPGRHFPTLKKTSVDYAELYEKKAIYKKECTLL